MTVAAPVAASATQLRTRWWALMVLCLGVLMIVLDTTIGNVALPYATTCSFRKPRWSGSSTPTC